MVIGWATTADGESKEYDPDTLLQRDEAGSAGGFTELVGLAL